MQASGPNAEQISYWNEISGPKWVALSDLIDEQIAPIGNEAIDESGIGAGARVLDVGCGCGQTSVALARRAGAGGSVLGVDISGPMLASARERAAGAGIANLSFIQADAQTHDFVAGSIDHIFSRFGVMFFADPPAAFANLRRALAPAGRLTFACWQALPKNQWMLVPIGAVAKHVALPAPAGPDAPGPFAFADAERVRGILERAGFEEIRIEPIERKLRVAAGMDLEAAIDFLMQMGPAGALLREAAPAVVQAAKDSMREALSPFQADGALEMASAAWLVSAANRG